MEKNNDQKPDVNSFEGFIQAAGVILAVTYPVLALSTGYRAIYRLFFKEGVTYFLPPAMSLVAAVCYLVATLGIVMRSRWGKSAWRLSIGVLVFETFMTLLVGTLSYTNPDLVGNTVWRNFGADYGFFPLFQPLLGIAWLLNREVKKSFFEGQTVDRVDR